METLQSPTNIKEAMQNVKPGSPEEAMLLGQHRLSRAREINQPVVDGTARFVAETNANAMIESAQREIDIRGQHAAHIAVEAAVGHESHIKVHSV